MYYMRCGKLTLYTYIRYYMHQLLSGPYNTTQSARWWGNKYLTKNTGSHARGPVLVDSASKRLTLLQHNTTRGSVLVSTLILVFFLSKNSLYYSIIRGFRSSRLRPVHVAYMVHDRANDGGDYATDGWREGRAGSVGQLYGTRALLGGRQINCYPSCLLGVFFFLFCEQYWLNTIHTMYAMRDKHTWNCDWTGWDGRVWSLCSVR